MAAMPSAEYEAQETPERVPLHPTHTWVEL